jgi:DNA-directed RNA polymerase subunit omega
MARITVEDCLEKVDNQYDLVLLAKERTVQLNAGSPMLVEEDNDKRTIISLREIGDGKVSVKELEQSAIKRLRKEPDEAEQQEETEEETNDDFENLYKGQVSKSGIAILPSKRTRKIPEVKKIAAIEKETEIKQEDIFVKKDAQVNENVTIGDDKPEAPATNEDPLTLKKEVTE